MIGWDISKIQKRKITEYFSHPNGQNVFVEKKNRFLKTLWTIIALIVVILVITFVFRKVLLVPGKPPGIDTDSFTHTAQTIADYWREHRYLPAIDPYWYNDFEIKYAPPLIYPPLIIVYFLTGNSDYTGSFVFYLIGLFSALTMFYVIKKQFSLFNAIIGSLMFSLAPLIFMESRTMILAVAFLPLAFYFTNQLLEKRKYSALLILSIIFALAISAHIMYGLMIIVALMVYGILYLILSKKIAGNSLPLLLIVPVLSILLISFYLLPYIIGGGAWTSLSPESYLATSEKFFTIVSKINIVYALVSLYVVIRYRNPQRLALFITSLLASFLALGVYSPIPILFSIFRPNAWLLFASFGFVYLSATAIDFRQILKLKTLIFKTAASLLILGLGLYFSNQFNQFTRYHNSAKFTNDPELVAKLSQKKGRVLPLQDIFQLVYTREELAKQADIYSNDGHYYALVQPRSNLAFIYDNINYNYPRQAINLLKHQNTSYILVNPQFFNLKKQLEISPNQFNALQRQKMQNAINFLAEIEKNDFYLGYQDEYSHLNPTLFSKREESGYLQPIREKIFIIGRYANNAAAILSDKNLDTVQAGSMYLDDYDLSFLNHFDSLILYGFGYRDKKKAEDLIKEYAQAGGKVIIDLTGVQKNKLEDLPTFLGVTGIQKNLQNQFSLEKNEGSSNLLPTQFNIPNEIISQSEDGLVLESKPLLEWRFMTYLGLDKAVLRLKEAEETTAALGYKEINGPEGASQKIWFVGPNLFYHAYLTHSEPEIEFVRKLVTNENKIAKNTNNTYYEQMTVLSQTLEPEFKKFTYTAQKATPLLVSFTYSPHWQAYLDGQKIKVYNLENLMGINLPAGEHSVEMKYDRQNPPTATYGKWISITAIIILLLPLIVGRFRQFRKAPR